jgi:hypothetical protein
MRKVNQIIYGAFGALTIAYGLAALLSPATLSSEAARSFHSAHLLREQGAAGLFIGLMFLWCIFNYECRSTVHYFLMLFAFMLAAIHWFDYFGGHLPWISPVYNSVPFAVLLVMAILSRRVSSVPSNPR